MLTGVLVAALLTFSDALFGIEGGISFLWVAWWSFVVSLLGVGLGSLLSPAYPRSRLNGLVVGHPDPGDLASEGHA